MDELEGKELVTTLQTLKSQTKAWRFVYLAQGADGAPQLRVQKILPQAMVVALRQAAKNKTMWSTGWVKAAPDRRSFIFYPEIEPPPKLLRDLSQGELGKLSRLLKVSTIAPTGTDPGERAEATDLDTSRSVSRETTLKASLTQKVATEKQKEVQVTMSRYVDLEQRLGDTVLRKKACEDDVDKRQKVFDDALKKVDDLQGKWFKKDAKKQAATKVETARGRLEDMRNQLLTMVTGRKLAGEQLEEVHRVMEIAEVATIQAEQARALAARARAETAAAVAVKAEAAAAEKERAFAAELKKAAKGDPELAKAIDMEATLDAQARQAISAAMLAQDKVGALHTKLGKAPLDEQAAIQLELDAAEQELTEALARAKEVSDAANQAVADLGVALKKITTGPLADASKARDEARTARDEADEAEVVANVSADDAEETVERNVALRKPKIVVEGLTNSQFETFVSFLPIGDPLTRVDFEKKRVGIGYDALAYAQQNRNAVAQLDGMPPMKGHPLPKLGARFGACWGTDAYKEELEQRKASASRAGQEMVDTFDWESRREEMAGKEDELDLALTGKTPSEAVATLLADDKPGILFGESHSDPQTQNFMYDNFDEFVRGGVDTIYSEHITVELQSVVDSWLASDATEMPAPLKKALYAVQVVKDQYPRNLVGVLEKAKVSGMRIQGIDTTAAKGDLDPTCDDDKSERVRRMNALAGDKMGNDPKRKGKFIALTGAAHNTPHAGSPKPVPGIGDLLGVLPVELDTSGVVKVDRGDPTVRPAPVV